jgi:uncharacterized membrane protein
VDKSQGASLEWPALSARVDHNESKHRLRRHKSEETDHRHPVNVVHHEDRTFGERIADHAAAAIGSWTFLIVQSVLLAIWIAVNAIALFALHWDPYPFILLNLLLSVQAAYAAPVLMLAGVRQAKKDRLTLEHAALEADTSSEAIDRILANIRQNTQLTLQIIKELEVEA